MHIEQGIFKGRKIVGQKAGLRPTTSKVKAALFNKIRQQLAGRSFVDCFAGTGTVGFEAISVGAHKVGFIELNKKAVEYLYKNTKNFGIEDKVTIKNQDVLDFLKSQYEEWDFLFFSPPYDTIHWYQLLRHIEYSPILKENTLVIIQHPSTVAIDTLVLDKVETKQYGFNCLTYLKKKAEE